ETNSQDEHLGLLPKYSKDKDGFPHTTYLFQNKDLNLVEISFDNFPGDILSASDKLGIQLPTKTKEALESLANKRADRETDRLLDTIIAGNIIDDDGNFRKEDESHEGEALFVLSLQGNNEAKEKLDKRLTVLQNTNGKRKEDEKREHALEREKFREKKQ